MRKIRFKSRAVAVLAAALLPLLAAAGVITYTATYDNSKLTLGTDTLGGVTYTTVHYNGLYNGGEPGTPSLPIDYLRFSVPYNAANFSVSTTVRMPVNNSISHLVYPNQAPRLMNDTTPVIINLPDTAAYYSGTTYPSVRAWVADEGFLAGENHIVTVAVMPIAYSHTSTSDMLILSRTVNLTLNYSISDSTTFKPLVRNDSVLRQEGFQLAQSMVLNPNQVIAYSPAGPIAVEPLVSNLNLGGYEVNGHGHVGDDPIFPPIDPPQPIDTTLIYTDSLGMGDNYRYLIITTDELLNSTKRLAALQRQKGYTVRVMTVNDIVNHILAQPGDEEIDQNGDTILNNSDAGKIRQFLRRSFIYCGTQYVLFVGTDVPYIRNSFYDNIPTDYYYSELHSSPKIMMFDLMPELYVGRILAKVPFQIDNYTDKLLRYELNPGNGDTSYLIKGLFTESHDFIGDLKLVTDTLYSVGIIDTMFIREIDYGRYPKARDIIDSLNVRHVGFLATFNHGSPSSIITYGLSNNMNYSDRYYWLWGIDTVRVSSGYHPNSDTETGNGLNCLDNQYQPMIYYALSCETAKYDYEEIPMNYGESFTTGKDYGGPIYLGYTSTANDISMEQLARYFSNNLKKGYFKIGVASDLSRSYNLSNGNRLAALAHNLLGDPSLEIWTGLPQYFDGIHVTRTDSAITVSGIHDADSTIVAYYSNNGICKYVRASTGYTFNGVSPNGSVMLYKHNYIPYIAPLELQDVTMHNSQYVIASDVIAGSSIVNNRSYGDVIIKSGIKYEIEASGKVTLESGFLVEKGATFAVYPPSF